MQGVFGAVWGLAGLVGPLLGGAIVHYLSWRWVFYVNLPFGLGCAAVLAVAYHERVERHEHRLDLGGRGAPRRWRSWRALLARPARARPPRWRYRSALLALGRSSCGSSGAPQEPLVPLDLFRQRVMAVASATGAPHRRGHDRDGDLRAAVRAERARRDPDRRRAPRSRPWPSAGRIASALAGRLLPRPGYRRLVRGGLAPERRSRRPGARAPAPAGRGAPRRRALTFAYGVGLGFANTPLVIAVQSSVPWNRRGVATASTMFFRTIGGTLAVGRPRRACSRTRSRASGRTRLASWSSCSGPERGAPRSRGGRGGSPGAPGRA